jgi:hypothetical protein
VGNRLDECKGRLDCKLRTLADTTCQVRWCFNPDAESGTTLSSIRRKKSVFVVGV